jgi:ligand-binding sensor domain-containing protein
MRNQLRLLLLVCLFFAGCKKQDSILTRTEPNTFTSFNKQNSPLPDNQVNAVSVAGSSVWVGTQNGLAQLSNGTWKVFTTNNSGLPSPVILSVVAVEDNCVWIGTDKGLVQYCQNKWTLYNTNNSLLKNNVVKKIAVDQQRNRVWAGTEGGLFKLSGNRQEWFDDTNSGLMENLVTALAITAGGNLVVGTFDHFQFQGSNWQYDGNHWTRVRLNNLGYSSSFVNTLFVRGEQWWMGIGGTSGGAILAMKNGQATTHHHRENSPIMGGVLAVAEDEKALWVATGAGLYQLMNGHWKHFTTKNSKLPDDHILCMEVVNGKLYLGTLQAGLVEFHP